MQQEFTRRGRPGVRRFCEGCGRSFVADAWDAKRGFGRFCTKSCGQRGRPNPPRGKRNRETEFWRYVERGEGCWLWRGRIDASGYGVVVANVRAHCFSWELHRGQIPAGFYVCHNCPGGDNPLCVRPEHLWLGTHQENQRDYLEKCIAADVPNHGGRLRPSQKSRIIWQLTFGARHKDLALEYGVSSSRITKIAKDACLSHRG